MTAMQKSAVETVRRLANSAARNLRESRMRTDSWERGFYAGMSLGFRMAAKNAARDLGMVGYSAWWRLKR
jgi:hypothetical protein